MSSQIELTKATISEIANRVFEHMGGPPTDREIDLVVGLVSALLPRINSAFIHLDQHDLVEMPKQPDPDSEQPDAS